MYFISRLQFQANCYKAKCTLLTFKMVLLVVEVGRKGRGRICLLRDCNTSNSHLLLQNSEWLFKFDTVKYGTLKFLPHPLSQALHDKFPCLHSLDCYITPIYGLLYVTCVICLLSNAENFHEVLCSTTVHQQVNFNFESTFVKQYFGTDHSHELSYEEFVQLLQVHMCIRHISTLYCMVIYYLCRVFQLNMLDRHLLRVIQKERAQFLQLTLSN